MLNFFSLLTLKRAKLSRFFERLIEYNKTHVDVDGVTWSVLVLETITDHFD